MEYCNMIYQGFRNAVGIPLDIYYAGVEQDILVADGPMQCAEKFKLHLGNASMASPFDWKSSFKYETSFTGHTFVARLASNPKVVVDKFTYAAHGNSRLSPTKASTNASRNSDWSQWDPKWECRSAKYDTATSLGVEYLNGTLLNVMSP